MLPDFPIIVADESVDARIVRVLRQKGYRIYSVAEETPGITDDDVVSLATLKSAYILTEDKDFGDILVYNNTSNHSTGSMLIRIFDKTISATTELVSQTFELHSAQLLGNFAVLTSKKLRIRQYRV